MPEPTQSTTQDAATRGPAPLPNAPGERISYTLKNAAEAIDLSIATLRRLNKAGRLQFIRIGGRTLVCARSLHALAAGQKAA